MIGMSYYEGLCAKQFDLVQHVKDRAAEGYKFIRIFIDLPFWTGASMNPDKSLFLYQYDKITKKYNPNQINPNFVRKLHDAAKAAKQGGMTDGITICIATNPKYYAGSTHVSYPRSLGYTDTIGFMQVVNVHTPAWQKFAKYVSDLARICHDAPNPNMLRVFETYNELKRWGSIMDSHPALQKTVKAQKANALMQMNPPLEELHRSFEEQGQAAFKWPLRLMSGVSSPEGFFKATRITFHGFFLGSEVTEEAAFLKNGGMDLNRIVFETDGATPNGTFSMENNHGHYLWREKWDDNMVNTNKVIAAHRGLIAAAKTAGVSLNIQSPVKWSLLQETPSLKKFYTECAKELQA
ncbi:hypothetical protein L0244_06250 [bacterium]|nr:hypothetical protein [bacterium]